MESTAQDIPDEVRQSLAPVIRKYRESGWSDFLIKRPDASTYAGLRVSVHATSPSGIRIHQTFNQDEDLARAVGVALGAQK